jgi:hypothetical protein
MGSFNASQRSHHCMDKAEIRTDGAFSGGVLKIASSLLNQVSTRFSSG